MENKMGYHGKETGTVQMKISRQIIKTALSIILLHCFVLPVVGAGEIQVTVETNWAANNQRITIVEPLPEYLRTTNRATAAYNANQIWRSYLPHILSQSLHLIPLNESESAAQGVANINYARTIVDTLANNARLTHSGLSTDFQNVQGVYEISIYPTITGLFNTHTQTQPVPKSFNWVASDNYSGIVIFATGELPIHGANTRGVARPALQPKIYDEQLRLILENQMVPATISTQQGLVAYDTKYRVEEWTQRIGRYPIRLIARGLLSSAGSALIIDDRDANMLLFRDHNRNLIANGRILIILNTIYFEKSLTTTIE